MMIQSIYACKNHVANRYISLVYMNRFIIMNFSPEASCLPLNIVAMCAKPFEVNTLQWGLIDGQYTGELKLASLGT